MRDTVHMFSKPRAVMERITDVIAAAGVATWFSPEVVEWFHIIDEPVAILIPPVSLLWLLTQLWKYWGRGIK